MKQLIATALLCLLCVGAVGCGSGSTMKSPEEARQEAEAAQTAPADGSGN